ncbi:MAG: hypothetical protein JWQ09_247 [Segetibacter sp.]|nr:hypothetical protein [Segetibacter sp.]
MKNLLPLLFAVILIAGCQSSQSNEQKPQNTASTTNVKSDTAFPIAQAIYDNKGLTEWKKASTQVKEVKTININEPVEKLNGKQMPNLIATLELVLFTSRKKDAGSILDSAKLYLIEGAKNWSFNAEISSSQINMGTQASVLGFSDCTIVAELNANGQYSMRTKLYYFYSDGRDLLDSDKQEVKNKIATSLK